MNSEKGAVSAPFLFSYRLIDFVFASRVCERDTARTRQTAAQHGCAPCGNPLQPQFTDPNQPMSNAHFGGACSAYDACYAAQLGHSFCNSTRINTLNTICSGLGCAPGQCNRSASACISALARSGGDAYIAHQQNTECTLWHYDMERNQCPK